MPRCGSGPARWLGVCVVVAVAAALGCQPGAPAASADGGGPATAAPVATTRGDADRGRGLLAQYQCGSCHTIPGVAGSRGLRAASLDGYGRRSYIAGRVQNEPDLLARWIAEPQALIPGTPMPDMGASDADARDMAAYLGALR